MKEGDLERLKRVAQYEETIDWSKQGTELGWEWRDVRIQPAILSRLFIEGLLDNPFKSNSYTGYLLSEKGKLALQMGEVDQEPIVEPHPLEIPDNLFDTIEGYQDIKDLVMAVLKSESPVHLLFAGVPASAKTMFLLELARLGAPYILGSQSSKAGITDVLFDMEPEILLVDEIDRIRSKDITVLLSLTETGIVAETKHSKHREIKLNTKVFATSNTTKMPPELLSRFMILNFRPYSQDEFLTVATAVLVKRENCEEKLASYIAQRVWQLNDRFPDPRQAVRVARLAKTTSQVDKIFTLLYHYAS
jgi:Holliday junction DNA helicase RuvB